MMICVGALIYAAGTALARIYLNQSFMKREILFFILMTTFGAIILAVEENQLNFNT